MKKYRAEIDVISQVWERVIATVEAESEEEAIEKINDFEYDIEDSTDLDYAPVEIIEICSLEEE